MRLLPLLEVVQLHCRAGAFRLRPAALIDDVRQTSRRDKGRDAGTGDGDQGPKQGGDEFDAFTRDRGRRGPGRDE